MTVLSIFICVISLIMSGFFFTKMGYSLNPTRINFGSFVLYFQFILSAGTGVTLVGMGVSDHYIINSVNLAEISNTVILCISYSFVVSTGAAYILLRILYGNIPARIRANQNTPYSHPNLISNLFFFILIAINYAIVVYTVIHIGSIPLLDLLTGNASLERRITISRSFSGNEIIKNLFGTTLSLILCFASAQRLFDKFNRSSILIFLLCFGSAVFFATHTYEKAPLIFLLFGLLIAWVMIRGAISTRKLILFACVIFSIVVIQYLLLGIDREDLASSGITGGPVGRILFTQVSGLYLAFSYFPQQHDFLGFSSIGKAFSSAFGIESQSERVARINMEIFNPSGVADGIAGVINTYYVAEAWGNFGLWGIFFAPVIVGIWIALVNVIEFNMPKSFFNRSIVIFLALKLPFGGGINDFIFSVNLIFVFIVLFVASLIGDSLADAQHPIEPCIREIQSDSS